MDIRGWVAVQQSLPEYRSKLTLIIMELQKEENIKIIEGEEHCARCEEMLVPAIENNGGSEPQTKYNETVGFLKCNCTKAKQELRANA